MSNKITLSREELDSIQTILQKILGDKDKNFTLTQNRVAGLGSVLTLSFDYVVDGIQGKYETEISGVETW